MNSYLVTSPSLFLWLASKIISFNSSSDIVSPSSAATAFKSSKVITLSGLFLENKIKAFSSSSGESFSLYCYSTYHFSRHYLKKIVKINGHLSSLFFLIFICLRRIKVADKSFDFLFRRFKPKSSQSNFKVFHINSPCALCIKQVKRLFDLLLLFFIQFLPELSSFSLAFRRLIERSLPLF